jgi:hypothetical protein
MPPLTIKTHPAKPEATVVATVNARGVRAVKVAVVNAVAVVDAMEAETVAVVGAMELETVAVKVPGMADAVVVAVVKVAEANAPLLSVWTQATLTPMHSKQLTHPRPRWPLKVRVPNPVKTAHLAVAKDVAEVTAMIVATVKSGKIVLSGHSARTTSHSQT